MTAPAVSIGDRRAAPHPRGRASAVVIGVARRLLDVVLVALFVGSFALVALTVVLPRTGHQLFIVRSGSMTPAMPTGSLVVIGPLEAGGPTAGDVVTIRLDSGVVVTHRVTRVFDLDGVPYIATKGDANEF